MRGRFWSPCEEPTLRCNGVWLSVSSPAVAVADVTVEVSVASSGVDSTALSACFGNALRFSCFLDIILDPIATLLALSASPFPGIDTSLAGPIPLHGSANAQYPWTE